VTAPRIAFDEDYHVHSTFSDGSSTLAENVAAAQERGLRTLCLVDHVRRDTAWVPEFAAAVDQYRGLGGMTVLAGVEAKILDTSGRLDLPPGLDGTGLDGTGPGDGTGGIDLVLIADHQFPGEQGPVHPAEAAAAIERGEMTPAGAIERLCTATANALAAGRPALVAHLFSVLPKIGLSEELVPDRLLAHLAGRAARAGAMVEVNEKWSCPSVRSLSFLAAAGVPLVASSDSHHCASVGAYSYVRQAAGPARVA
jgi:putative hydrolase